MYVDVRSDNDNHSIAVSEVLESLGASIANKLLPHVTHIIFKNGSRTTLTTAKQYKCKVVSVQWVERYVSHKQASLDTDLLTCLVD